MEERIWDSLKRERSARLLAAGGLAKGKIVAAKDTVKLLEAVIRPGDKVNLAH